MAGTSDSDSDSDSRQTNTESKEEYHRSTFAHWPSDPEYHISDQRREELVKAGFIYTRDRDVVRCTFCDVVMSVNTHWRQREDVLEAHYRRNTDEGRARCEEKRSQQQTTGTETGSSVGLDDVLPSQVQSSLDTFQPSTEPRQRRGPRPECRTCETEIRCGQARADCFLCKTMHHLECLQMHRNRMIDLRNPTATDTAYDQGNAMIGGDSNANRQMSSTSAVQRFAANRLNATMIETEQVGQRESDDSSSLTGHDSYSASSSLETTSQRDLICRACMNRNRSTCVVCRQHVRGWTGNFKVYCGNCLRWFHFECAPRQTQNTALAGNPQCPRCDMIPYVRMLLVLLIMILLATRPGNRRRSYNP